ncbi:hypothetical protein [Robiginitalea aurantiaca]|uniref:Uncharacterized protein n=1 Tax=Robiginitalea aurantiaca TaxID=3056915 RepID=A0ABT7WH84_9FLAO|nr:hypothetical protein [Robiginitalea aurantiaca]MDM9632281.1 hypothetical protein [Robiginitalea aurantiaca]
MKTKFSSFEEIDVQLEILRTQRQLSLYRLKSQLEKGPMEIVRSGIRHAVLPSLKNLVIDWSLDRLRRLRRTLRPELPPAA